MIKAAKSGLVIDVTSGGVGLAEQRYTNALEGFDAVGVAKREGGSTSSTSKLQSAKPMASRIGFTETTRFNIELVSTTTTPLSWRKASPTWVISHGRSVTVNVLNRDA